MGILKKNNQLEKYSPMWSASMSRPTWLLSDESPDRPDWCWLVLAAVTGSWRRLMFSAPSRVFMNLNTKISSSLTFSANGRETRGARTTGARGARSKQSVQQLCGYVRSAMYTNILGKWKNLYKINEIQKLEWETEKDQEWIIALLIHIIFIKHQQYE